MCRINNRIDLCLSFVASALFTWIIPVRLCRAIRAKSLRWLNSALAYGHMYNLIPTVKSQIILATPQPSTPLPTALVADGIVGDSTPSQPRPQADGVGIPRSQAKSFLYSALRQFIMDIQLINIGFGNIVSANRVVAIVSPESAPIKRIITDARDRGQLIDATYGRRTRAVIITDSSHVILSAIQPETVANRFVISRDGHGDN